MNFPVFTAEKSLYPSNRLYRRRLEVAVTAVEGAVYPQGCSWWKGAVCSGPISACAPLCAAEAAVGGNFCGCMNNCLWTFFWGTWCLDCVNC